MFNLIVQPMSTSQGLQEFLVDGEIVEDLGTKTGTNYKGHVIWGREWSILICGGGVFDSIGQDLATVGRARARTVSRKRIEQVAPTALT